MGKNKTDGKGNHNRSKRDTQKLKDSHVDPFYPGYTGSYTAFPIDKYLDITISNESYEKYSNDFTLIDMIMLFIHIQKEKEHDYGKAIIRVIGDSASTQEKLKAKEFVPTMIYWHSLYLLYHFFRTPGTPLNYNISLNILESMSSELMTNFYNFINNIEAKDKQQMNDDDDNTVNKFNVKHSMKLFNLATEILIKIYNQQNIIIAKTSQNVPNQFIRTITGLSDLCRNNERDLATFIQNKCDIDSEIHELESQVEYPDKFFALVRPIDFKPKYYFNNSGIATSFLPDWNEKNKQTNCQFIDPGNTVSENGPYYKNQNETVGSINMNTTYTPNNTRVPNQSHDGIFIREIKINKLNIDISFDIPVYYEQNDKQNKKYIKMKYKSTTKTKKSTTKNPIELTNVYKELASNMSGIENNILDSLTLKNIKKMIEITEKKVSGDFGFITQSLFGNETTPSIIANNDDTIGYLIKILYLFMDIDFKDLLEYEEHLNNIDDTYTTNECPNRMTPYICSALSDRTDKMFAFSRPYSFMNKLSKKVLTKMLELQKENRENAKHIEEMQYLIDQQQNALLELNSENTEQRSNIEKINYTVDVLNKTIKTMTKNHNDEMIEFMEEMEKEYDEIDRQDREDARETEITIEDLSHQNNELNRKHNLLQEEYNILLSNHKIIDSNYNILDSSYNILTQQNIALNNQFNDVIIYNNILQGILKQYIGLTEYQLSNLIQQYSNQINISSTENQFNNQNQPYGNQINISSTENQLNNQHGDIGIYHNPIQSPISTSIPYGTPNVLTYYPDQVSNYSSSSLGHGKKKKKKKNNHSGKKKKSLKKEKKNKNKKKEKKQYSNKKYKSSKIKLKNVSIKKHKKRNTKPI